MYLLATSNVNMHLESASIRSFVVSFSFMIVAVATTGVAASVVDLLARALLPPVPQ